MGISLFAPDEPSLGRASVEGQEAERARPTAGCQMVSLPCVWDKCNRCLTTPNEFRVRGNQEPRSFGAGFPDRNGAGGSASPEEKEQEEQDAKPSEALEV